MGKFKLIDKLDRKKLAEGRDYGHSVAFAKKTGNEFVVTTCPITACKDFLNEIVFSQATQKPYTIYGLHSKYVPGLFEKNKAYLVMGIERQGRALNEYANYKRDYEILKSNYKNLEKALNWFEEKFKLKNKTKIFEIEKNRYICEMPKFWVEGTYRISLYTLLLRTLMFWKEGDLMDFLKNFKYDNQDVYIINGAIPKIQRMLDGFIPNQNLNEIKCPHSIGIIGYNFPDKIEKPPKLKPIKLKTLEEVWE